MEYQELQKTKKAQEEEIKHRQMLYSKLRACGQVHTTVRSTKELTIPVTPVSHLESRRGKKTYSTTTEAESTPVKPISHSSHLHVTIPVPFHLSGASKNTDKKESTDSTSSYTTAELLQKYQNNSLRKHEYIKPHVSVTIPHTPHLNTEKRSNSVSRQRPQSFEDKEIEEMEKMKAKSFKARTLDKRIFESMGELGVPKVQPKEVTIPQEFNLLSDRRSSYHKQMSESMNSEQCSNETSFVFKAREMPNFSRDPRESIVHVPSKTTEANSPNFSGNLRASSAPARRQREKYQPPVSPPKTPKHIATLTDPVPFKFQTDARGEVAKSALQSRIERDMEAEKKAREVHATPYPEKIFAKSFHVQPADKKLTEFEEFQLASVDRHNESINKLRELEKQRDLKQTEEAIFHAKQMPKTTFETKFEVVASDRELTKPLDIRLAIDQRASRRKEYDDYIAKQIALKTKEKEKLVNDKLEMEKKTIQDLRKKSVDEGGLCFKATPIMEKDIYPVRHVESAPLTEPVTPHLHTAARSRITNH